MSRKRRHGLSPFGEEHQKILHKDLNEQQYTKKPKGKMIQGSESLSRFNFILPESKSDNENNSNSDLEQENSDMRSEREQREMEDLLRHKILVSSIQATNSHAELQKVLMNLDQTSRKTHNIKSEYAVGLTEKELKMDLNVLKEGILKAYAEAQNKTAKKVIQFTQNKLRKGHHSQQTDSEKVERSTAVEFLF